MNKLLARLLALILTVTLMAGAVLVLVNLQPEGVGGYVVLALSFALAIGLPIAVYRAMMTRYERDHPRETNVGAGLAMGTAVDSRRKRDEDSDDFDLMQ